MFKAILCKKSENKIKLIYFKILIYKIASVMNNCE